MAIPNYKIVTKHFDELNCFRVCDYIEYDSDTGLISSVPTYNIYMFLHDSTVQYIELDDGTRTLELRSSRKDEETTIFVDAPDAYYLYTYEEAVQYAKHIGAPEDCTYEEFKEALTNFLNKSSGNIDFLDHVPLEGITPNTFGILKPTKFWRCFNSYNDVWYFPLLNHDTNQLSCLRYKINGNYYRPSINGLYLDPYQNDITDKFSLSIKSDNSEGNSAAKNLSHTNPNASNDALAGFVSKLNSLTQNTTTKSTRITKRDISFAAGREPIFDFTGTNLNGRGSVYQYDFENGHVTTFYRTNCTDTETEEPFGYGRDSFVAFRIITNSDANELYLDSIVEEDTGNLVTFWEDIGFRYTKLEEIPGEFDEDGDPETEWVTHTVYYKDRPNLMELQYPLNNGLQIYIPVNNSYIEGKALREDFELHFLLNFSIPATKYFASATLTVPATYLMRR